MRAKSAVIIKVASNFLRLCGRAAGSRCVQVARACRHLRTEAERRACAASGDGATYLTHAQFIQGLHFLFSRPRAGPGGLAGLRGCAGGLQCAETRNWPPRVVSKTKFVSPITSV